MATERSLRVWISATNRDLDEHRKRAQDAVLRLGMTPVLAQDIPAGDREVFDAIMKALDTCDVYIGIIAHRYGYIPRDERNPDNLSYMELEYIRAGEQRIPRLCFLIDEKYPWPPQFIEQGEAQQKLRVFKDRIASQVIFRPFTTPETLGAEVARALDALLREPPVVNEPGKDDLTALIRRYKGQELVDRLRAQGWLEQLAGAALIGIDLESAYLPGVDLREADLSRAYLANADLREAELTAARLNGTNLRQADLYYANLDRADLRGANLAGARLGYTRMPNVQMDGNTILPDDSRWTTSTDLRRFTDPEAPNFWRPASPEPADSPNAQIEQGIADIQAGQVQQGAQLLATALKDEALDDKLRSTALLWLAETTRDARQKRSYYNQALKADPDNEQARARLAEMSAPPSVPPPNQPPDAAPPRDHLTYLADVTMPDGTVIKPGETFTKTWRVRNDGQSTWGDGYWLAHTGGEQMSAIGRAPLPALAPGEEGEVSVVMSAPAAPGSYRSEWTPTAPDGLGFNNFLFVEIRVAAGDEAPAEPKTEPPTPQVVETPPPVVEQAGTQGGAGNDEVEGQKDQLNFKPYVEAFAELMRSPYAQPPLTIGIFGSWGVGKSFLLENIANQIEENQAADRRQQRKTRFDALWNRPLRTSFGALWAALRRLWGRFRGVFPALWQALLRARRWIRGDEEPEVEQTTKDAPPQLVYVVEYNAWQYSATEQVWPGLVRLIMNRAEREIGWFGWFFGRLRHSARRFAKQVRLWMVVLAGVFIGLLTYANMPVSDRIVFAQGPVSPLLPFPQAAQAVLNPLVAFVQGASPFVLTAFGVSLLRIVADALLSPAGRWVARLVDNSGEYGKPVDFMSEIENDLRMLSKALERRHKRIVVMIDDLDRCEPEKAVEMLKSIKLLLNFKSFIVFLGIDARVITLAVEKHYKDLLGEAGASGYEYLDKIVQIPFRIPEPDPKTIMKFLRQQLRDPQGLGERDEAPLPTLIPEPAAPSAGTGPAQYIRRPGAQNDEIPPRPTPPPPDRDPILTQLSFDERQSEQYVVIRNRIEQAEALKAQQMQHHAITQWAALCAAWPDAAEAMARVAASLSARQRDAGRADPLSALHNLAGRPLGDNPLWSGRFPVKMPPLTWAEIDTLCAYTHPRSSDRPFTADEQEAFESLARAGILRPNPRHLKRMINVYRLVRLVADKRSERLPPAATVRWLVLCAQWPYTTFRMLEHFETLPQRPPSDNALRTLYDAVKPTLEAEKQERLDDDLPQLEKLIGAGPGWIDWDGIARLQQYTVNFNPAIEAEAAKKEDDQEKADGKAQSNNGAKPAKRAGSSAKKRAAPKPGAGK